MSKPYHPCLQCGKGVRFNGGAFCRSCLRTLHKTLLVGSIGREIAARRAHELLEMVAETKQPPQVLANVAASQLARAWGVERKRV